MLSWISALAIAALGALVGAGLALRFVRARAAWRGRRDNARGKRGERDAERLLRAHGYRVLARQQHARYPLTVDGDSYDVELVIDFVVERNGERFVVEVKTGDAARLDRADTRRQLLEYQLASSAARVLLVEAEAGRIRELSFPIEAEMSNAATTWPIWFAFAALAALAFWYRYAH
jgi:Holliday junction resolvase-like predicted endonuclease